MTKTREQIIEADKILGEKQEIAFQQYKKSQVELRRESFWYSFHRYIKLKNKNIQE